MKANLHNIALKGEAASADTISAEKFPQELKEIISASGNYTPKQIFNVDETGLFWKPLPFRTYISRTEKFAPGYKASKERFTLLLGGNAEGNFKFKPLVINQSENPKSMKGVDKRHLPVHWRSNKKTWMTAALFQDWVTNCAIPEKRAYCSKENLDFKALILIDNAPGHPAYVNEINENVQFLFLPPNTTSLIQRMDQGAISTF